MVGPPLGQQQAESEENQDEPELGAADAGRDRRVARLAIPDEARVVDDGDVRLEEVGGGNQLPSFPLLLGPLDGEEPWRLGPEENAVPYPSTRQT